MTAPAKRFPWWTTSAAVSAVLGNVIAALIPVSTLLQMPPGSSGRLMAEVYYAFIVAGVTFITVIGLAIVGVCRERHRILIIIAVCFSLMPFFFSSWVMNRVAEKRHIFLEP